jgi:hypothetical protein
MRHRARPLEIVYVYVHHASRPAVHNSSRPPTDERGPEEDGARSRPPSSRHRSMATWRHDAAPARPQAGRPSIAERMQSAKQIARRREHGRPQMLWIVRRSATAWRILQMIRAAGAADHHCLRIGTCSESSSQRR